jgi:transcription elongation GreA/GreB family factor
MARALLGKRLDDEVRVHTPAGEREFLIAGIAYEAPA